MAASGLRSFMRQYGEKLVLVPRLALQFLRCLPLGRDVHEGGRRADEIAILPAQRHGMHEHMQHVAVIDHLHEHRAGRRRDFRNDLVNRLAEMSLHGEAVLLGEHAVGAQVAQFAVQDRQAEGRLVVDHFHFQQRRAAGGRLGPYLSQPARLQAQEQKRRGSGERQNRLREQTKHVSPCAY
jgi:hypothetical protein